MEPIEHRPSHRLSFLSILVVATFAGVVALTTMIATGGGRDRALEQRWYGMLASGNPAILGTFRTENLVVDTLGTFVDQVQIGPTVPSASETVLVSGGSDTSTGQVWLLSNTLNHVGILGNNEMINLVGRCNDAFDTGSASGHCSSLDVIADGTIATGSGTLTNTAIAANASCPGGGNCTAFSFNSQFGIMRNDGEVNFNASPDVQLGVHVENFAVVPQTPTTITPQLDVGAAFSVDGFNVHVTNTATGVANSGYYELVNTAVNSQARGGLTVKQGAAVGGNNMGLHASNVGEPFAGSVAGEWGLYNEQGPIVFGADTSGFVSATRLTANNHWVQDTSTGTPTTDSNCQSGTGEQAFGNDNAFTVTTGSTATSCVITFKKTWTIKPICTISVEGTSAAPQCIQAATAITCSLVTGSATYDFMCQGRPGAT